MFKRFGPVQWSTIKVGVNLWSTEERLVLDRKDVHTRRVGSRVPSYLVSLGILEFLMPLFRAEPSA